MNDMDDSGSPNLGLGADLTSSANPNDALYPIAVLIDELKHEDVTLRLNAIHRLSTIALALGAERARDELIPFLEESVDDEDEVLLALAEVLGTMVEYIGGAHYAHRLIGPLENLAAVEETVVREKAVASLSIIVQVFSSEQAEDHFVPAIKRLASGDWFTSRASACGLFTAVYPKLSAAKQDELRKLFVQLSADDTPMVRRSAATHLNKLVAKVQKDHILSDLMGTFNNLANDDQDSVRLLVVDSVIALADVFSKDESRTYLAGPLRTLCNDKSWRVRYMVADKFVGLIKAAGGSATDQEVLGVPEDLLQCFLHLLKDSEAEVRTAASGQVPGVAARVATKPQGQGLEQVRRLLMPVVKDLITDPSQHVRAALAIQLSGLAPILGKDGTIETLLPLFLQMLKDEFPEVRLNIISKLELVNGVIGIELLSQSLLPAIVELAEDKQWRVRLAIIEYIPLLGSQLGVQFFDEKLTSLCLSWLGDPVHSIREAATINLRKLTEVFGVDWAKRAILPKIVETSQHPNYLYRMTTVFAISTLAAALTPEVIRDHLLPVITQLHTDPIPNVRFNVAKALETLTGRLLPQHSTLVTDKIKPTLLKLNEDMDTDVRYFAHRALTTGTLKCL